MTRTSSVAQSGYRLLPDNVRRKNSLVSTDNFSLTRIICHRNFGNEFAFTHSKGYLYYLARSPLSRIFDIELNFHEHIFLRQTYFVKEILSVETRPI